MMRLLTILSILLCAPLSLADVLTVKENAPQTYVVVKGDTLWDISEKYLNSPWRWPELWGFNKQIADPHWIYPGDKLSLVYVDGKPKLLINKTKQKLVMTRHGRKSSKKKPIPTVSLEDIEQFLTHAKIANQRDLDNAPIIIGSERNALFYKKRDIIFSNKSLEVGQLYGIFRKGRNLISPRTNDLLGVELELVGQATVTVKAAISRLSIEEVGSQIQNGQFLLPMNEALPPYFMPAPAAKDIKSTIIASGNFYRESGKNNVVIIEGGRAQDIKVGNVFSIYQPGKIQFIDGEGNVRDPMIYRAYDNVKAYFIDDDTQRLPNVYRGDLLVFKSFENLSYALVINNIRPVRRGDDLINP